MSGNVNSPAPRPASATRVRRSGLPVALIALGAAGAAVGLPAGAQQPAPGAAAPDSAGPEWAGVQRALGSRGALQPAGVLRFAFPRGDLRVTVGDVAVRPALALGSWVAFRRTGNLPSAATMLMGDLVLTEDEVAPVMLALQRGGVEQSAVHNHLLHESPRIVYVHVMARGDGARLAATVRAALAMTGTPLSAPAAPPTPAPAAIDLDTAAVAAALGAHGRVSGGVYQVSVPRAGAVTERGVEIPPAMGVATAINFQPTGGGKAAATGDFVLTADEVNPVVRALREHGIEVTALHSHLLDESPRLFFMHFWANADALTLARGLRAALDRMDVRRPAAR